MKCLPPLLKTHTPSCAVLSSAYVMAVMLLFDVGPPPDAFR